MQDGIRIWKFSAKRICRTSVKIYCVASLAIASCSHTGRNLPPPSPSYKRWYSPKKLHGFLARIIKHKHKLVSKGKGQFDYLPVCIRSRKFSERDGIAMHCCFRLKKIVFEGLFDRSASSWNMHSTIRTVHTTYAVALKTTTHPKTRCRKPYAATQNPMLLMMGICTRNMSS